MTVIKTENNTVRSEADRPETSGLVLLLTLLAILTVVALLSV